MPDKQIDRRRFVGAVSAGAALGSTQLVAATSELPALLGGKPVRTERFPSWPVFDHANSADFQTYSKARSGTAALASASLNLKRSIPVSPGRNIVSPPQRHKRSLHRVERTRSRTRRRSHRSPYTFIATINVSGTARGGDRICERHHDRRRNAAQSRARRGGGNRARRAAGVDVLRRLQPQAAQRPEGEGGGGRWTPLSACGLEQVHVIISEPSSPWMTMAANLFTREFFEIGRSRLAPGGVFAQWLQLYGVTTDDLRSLVKTFATVFPHVTIFWTTPGQDMVLLGSVVPLEMDIGGLTSTMASPEVAQDLARINIRRVPDLLAYHLIGDDEVRAFAGDATLNTDDNALIEFRAPLTMHAFEQTGGANTRALDALAADPLARASGLPADSPAKRHCTETWVRRSRARRWGPAPPARFAARRKFTRPKRVDDSC